MKNYSYSLLISIVVGTLAIIFLIFAWKYEIGEVTFVYSQVMTYIACTSLVLSVVVLLLLMRKINSKVKTKMEFLKACSAIFLCALFLCSALLYGFTTTLIFILPGKSSHYITEYQYSDRSGRGSCAGARLYDPIQGEIKICNPAGAYRDNSKIYVEKRSNALGFVVTGVRTSF